MVTELLRVMESSNEFGQPIGTPLADWREVDFPPKDPIEGRYCRLEPLDAGRHAESLFAANALDDGGRNWTYLPYGPFRDFEAYREWVNAMSEGHDPQFYAVVVDGRALGVASYLRIKPKVGLIEVGHLHFSTLLKKTPAATEAMFLMMRQAFELGYRRYEWKCDSLNAPSRAAAKRLGFREEGVFRQATVSKGRNRDTAWYSVIDGEWPELEKAFEAWLDFRNFDEEGRQKVSLRNLK